MELSKITPIPFGNRLYHSQTHFRYDPKDFEAVCRALKHDFGEGEDQPFVSPHVKSNNTIYEGMKLTGCFTVEDPNGPNRIFRAQMRNSDGLVIQVADSRQRHPLLRSLHLQSRRLRRIPRVLRRRKR